MTVSKYGGFFPDLDPEKSGEETRPMPLEELPRQARIDRAKHVIRERHARIANAIEMFWGHNDCVEYIQQLILSGGDGVGHARIGFKQDVIAAFMDLIALHDTR
jgi:hypothetical protein